MSPCHHRVTAISNPPVPGVVGAIVPWNHSHHRVTAALNPPFSRRGGRHRALELPADAAGLEGVSGAGHGQHGGAQAGHLHPADGAPLRRDLRRGRVRGRGIRFFVLHHGLELGDDSVCE